MNTYKTILGSLSLAVVLGLSGCGGSSDTSTSSTSEIGSLSVQLTDAPGDYSAVYVTIDEIRVHKADTWAIETMEDNVSFENSEDISDRDSSWIVVANPHKTYNLLALQNGLSETLGEANISVGKYTQMRLILGNEEDNGTNILGNPHPYSQYVVFTDGSDVAPLDTPSDVVKQNHNFNIVEGSTIILTIDFDANKSIVEKGNGQYSLKPVLGLVSIEDEDENEDINTSVI